MGNAALNDGFPIATAVLGVLILGEVFKAMEDLVRNRGQASVTPATPIAGDRLTLRDIKRMAPNIARSSVIGTAIGALPGVGSTLAATLG